MQHVRSSFNVHLTCLQEAEHGMFLIVQGLQQHQLCEVTQKDNMTIWFLLTFTMSDLGSTTPRLSSSTCKTRHTWPHANTGSKTPLLQQVYRITRQSYVNVMLSMHQNSVESDLQLANGLHIAFQVGSRHPTEQLSTTGSHGDERVRTCYLAIVLS